MRPLLTAILSLTVLASAPALAAADGAAAKPDPAQMQAMMEQMGKTGPEHAVLKQAIGEWTIEESAWMDPAQPPMKTQYRCVFTEVLGGKWVRQEVTGEFMGQPYQGLGMAGYDTLAKRYVSTWHDSMSTATMLIKGESTDGGKTIVYKGTMENCPMTAGPMDMKGVLSFDSADRMTFSMAGIVDGKERKMFEMVYTRAAKK